jgi:AraC-like DNA-binding protein
MQNQIHIDKDYAWFTGSLDNNFQHKHYAIQLTIPLDDALFIKTPEKTVSSKLPVLIQSNVVHQITSRSRHFLILINPASTIGHFWKKITTQPIEECTLSPVIDLIEILRSHTLLPNEQLKKINEIILSHDCFCEVSFHHGDERVNRAFEFLKANYNRSVPLFEIADYCHISPTRFIHLFKEQTGISYRRAQLWIKLVQAVPLIGNKAITEIAHSAGFSDGAHFSRACKETFGLSPRELNKISQFIQV